MSSASLNFAYVVERSRKRKKSISIQVSFEKGVVVQTPYRTRDLEIKEVLQKNSDWVKRRLASIEQEKAQNKEHEWKTGENLFYLGECYTLEVGPLLARRGSCELIGRTLFVRCSARSGLTREEQVKKLLYTWYKQEALAYLSLQTEYFAKVLQLFPTTVIVKQQKKLWGSCDRHNIIRYNWKVIMATPALIDYLIVHELAHIEVKNHSKAFWDLVAAHIPDYKQKRRQLRSLRSSFN